MDGEDEGRVQSVRGVERSGTAAEGPGEWENDGKNGNVEVQ